MKSLLHARLFKLNIGPYTFSPGILPTVVTVFMLYVMVSLGQWQLSRADYKDNLHQKVSERKNLPPVTLQELPHDSEDRVFMPVIIEGKYDSQHHFLLDNRIINGLAGYDVYTPFIMSDGTAILVNRGWLKQGRTRQDLPQFETPSYDLRFKGLLDKPPAKGVILADNVHDNHGWPMVLQYIDTSEIEQVLGYQLLPMIVWLDAEAEHGFHREIPALKLDSAKNTGYAFQWFAMSAALFIIYIAVNVKRTKN
ncbi:MAG: SURF1 family protein [Gammaproteobacteria bacterium]